MKSLLTILTAAALCLTSCTAISGFLVSPLGQAALVTAETLGKQLAENASSLVLAQIITKADAQIHTLTAQGINPDISKEIVRTSEIAGLQAVYEAAQVQYASQNGARYIIPAAPKNPVSKITP
jgi:hypothetical protein